MKTKAFKIVAISTNTGSFGHTGYILVAEDGEAWEVLRIKGGGNHAWGRDLIIIAQTDLYGSPAWDRLSCECPRRLDECPGPVLNKIWKAA